MTAPFIHTYGDVLERLEYFARGIGVGADQTLRRMCVEEAYREVTKVRRWSCLEDVHRIHVRAPQTSGTVAFDLTGGTYERQLTLTHATATWPEAWCRDACVRLGSPDILCDIEDYKTSTVVTLDATMCPIADITSTTYSLFPRWYALPNDFLSLSLPMDEDDWILGRKVSKAEIEQLQKYDTSTGDISCYAVANVPDLFGTMGLWVWPPGDATETLDIPYRRRPRPLVYTGHDGTLDCAGTVTLTSGSATVTGSSTAFDSGMAGSILRVTSGSVRPTGMTGQYRWAEQYSIKSVESATSLTLWSNATTTRSAKAYTISDPIDLDEVVFDAFVACAQKNLAKMLKSDNYVRIEREYAKALREAKAADHRDHAPVIACSRGRAYTRPSDSPLANRTSVSGLD